MPTEMQNPFPHRWKFIAVIFALCSMASAVAQEDWPHYVVDWGDRLFRARVQGAYDWKGSGADRLETSEFTSVPIPFYQLGTDNRDLNTFPPRPEIDPDTHNFLEPKDWRDRRLLIQYLQNNSEVEQGYFESALDEDAVADTYYLMGNIYFLQSDFDQAISNYDRAISEFSDFKLAYKNKAFALARTGNCPAALDAIQEAVSRGAFSIHIKNLQAYCAYEAGDYSMAVEASSQSRVLGNSDSAMLEIQIHSLAALGNHEQALSLLKQLEDSNSAVALEALLQRANSEKHQLDQLALLEIKSRLGHLSSAERIAMTRLKIEYDLAHQVEESDLLNFIAESEDRDTYLYKIVESRIERLNPRSIEIIANAALSLPVSQSANIELLRTRNLLAKNEIDLGNIDEAANILRELMTNNPMNCQGMVLLSEVELALGNSAESETYSNRAASASRDCDNSTLDERALLNVLRGSFSAAHSLMLRDWNQKIARGEIPDELYVRKYRAISEVASRTNE